MENNTKCNYCHKEFYLKPSRKNRATFNYCSRSCCSNDKKQRYIGSNNPNHKYDIDINMLKKIDTSFKAWFLGWVLSDGFIKKNGSMGIQIHVRDINVLELIKNAICKDLKIKKTKNRNMVSLTIYSIDIINDIKKMLNMENNEYTLSPNNNINFEYIPDEFKYDFVRGYFEGNGTIRNIFNRKNVQPSCSITSINPNILNTIKSFVTIPSCIMSYKKNNKSYYVLEYRSTNAIDFLGRLYDKNPTYLLQRKREQYLDISNWEPRIPGRIKTIDHIKVHRTRLDAIIPSKANASDSGYDLTIIELIKQDGDMLLFDTGIALEPPTGYYIDVVPRSSISKTGYIMLNSIGIIDQSYRGSIKVALAKIDKTKPDLILPIKIAQIILMPFFNLPIIESQLSDTLRNDGGFGSTNKLIEEVSETR